MKTTILTICRESDAQNSRSSRFSQPVRRLLISAARVTFRAFPQAKASSFGQNLGEIHEVLITGTTDARGHLLLDRFRVLCVDEVPIRAVVADETTRLSAGVQ